MKALYAIFLILVMSFTLQAQFQVNPPANKNKFQNPIFSGDYPDPSILVDGEDYYLTFTTNDYYPGLPIWHSKDLINWTPVTYAITKNVGSVWAPDFVKHKDKYYIYFPAGGTNWVVWANNIEGPWSEPIDLKVKHIDPGHVVDENGNRYLHLNHGHCVSLSDDGLSVTSEVKKIYDGWQYPDEWIAECKCLEAPKLLKHGEYYYLTTGQGGTAGPPTSHMVIAARSKSPLGPWENSPYNPIIRTESKSEQWWSKGHRTLFEDKDGAWWMIFHGYENGYYHMGRSTLLQPVEWTKDGWYKTPNGIKTNKPIKRPKEKSEAVNFDLSDDFSGKELSFQWQFFKDYNPDRFELKDNSLILKARGKSVGESYPILCIPPHHSYTAQVDIEAEEGAKGGFTLFYDEDAFIDFSYESMEKVSLRLINNEGIVSFYYSIDDGKSWKKYHRSNFITSMNHNAYGGFLSLRLGLYAIGEGKVKFRNFQYQKVDEK